MNVLEQLRSALAGRYALEREIGQGGMATVYLARDVRHDRHVAVKVLNPELGAVVGVDRFLAEIRVTANLQHPHLLPLFDSGEAEGQLFYVMPYIDGESLRDRLRREKQLPIDEAVRIATAVGSALDHAHRRGVIHRDLKPENILLLEGQPLVADFGIALAVSVAGGERITQTGISLGTPQYMSPEQATGDRALDGRADIYSLGAVLYEMLSGEPPHTGSTAQAIIARVVTEKPRALHRSRESVPPHVEAAVECALAKWPADRFATAQDFVNALRAPAAVTLPAGWPTPGSIASDPAIAITRRRRHWISVAVPWVIAAVLATALVVTSRRPPSASPGVRRHLVQFPDSVRFRSPTGVNLAISPDGSRIAFTGGQEGGGAIYVRELADLDAKPVRGTERGRSPVFSPDGRQILFIVANVLKRVAIEGGTPTVVAETANQASWASDGTILFVRGRTLYRTSTAGEPILVAQADTSNGIEERYNWPRMLPGGKAALVSIVSDSGAVRRLGVITMNGDIIRFPLDGTCPIYLPTGHVVIGQEGGALVGVPFDIDDYRITGPPVTLLQSLIVKPGGAVDMDVANDGTMIYRTGLIERSLVMVDESGAQQPVFGEMHYYVWPRMSPDGRRVAVTIGGTVDQARNQVWMLDVPSATLTRLADAAERPEWSPDGKSVLMVRQGSPYRDVAIQPWNESGPATRYMVNPDPIMEVAAPTRNHGYVAARVGGGRQRDIWIAPVDSPAVLRPFVKTRADEYQPAVSADGTFLAYVSDETGRAEVYMRPMPGLAGRVQISTTGGSEPMWSPVASTVFYRDGVSFVAADIAWNDGVATVRRRVLFEDSFAIGGASRADYSVAPDGKHFLVLKSNGGDSRTILTENWFEDVKARMAASRR